ncbi:hypothetical protein HMPREF1980_01752 [Actinomyces sp. oral taxon 172 str. F0311]|nr:hypothetical protein HMPREF1980_01752 [Actinomyces sp. oral taxon 172 str. F0311]
MLDPGRSITVTPSTFDAHATSHMSPGHRGGDDHGASRARVKGVGAGPRPRRRPHLTLEEL